VKITFEGKTIGEILDQMQDVITLANKPLMASVPQDYSVQQANALQDIALVDKPVDSPVDKPVGKQRTAKQLENDERLRAAAKAKIAAKKIAKPPAPEPEDEAEEADPFDAAADPAETVKIRQKTLEDLQSAYANGHHQEVLELLSRFGNGAKSFRELPVEAFVPIREAIDKGALT
jgi:predicted lipid-binding transport protein (Tim44 family)